MVLTDRGAQDGRPNSLCDGHRNVSVDMDTPLAEDRREMLVEVGGDDSDLGGIREKPDHKAV